MEQKQRGGYRPNSGRKPTGRKMRSMRLTDSEYENVKECINAWRADEVETMVKMEVTERYGENKAYNGGTVEINVRSGQSYTYTLSNILGDKIECLYITSEYKNLEQSQAYWTRENGKIRGWLPAVLTIDDINRAAELI